jgi:hypothetical protein
MSTANEQQGRRLTLANCLVYLLALLGLGGVVGYAFPQTRYEIGSGGHIVMVRSSWWGLKNDPYPIRLQSLPDWKKGRPYRPPSGIDGYDWFYKEKNGEWWPVQYDDRQDTE